MPLEPLTQSARASFGPNLAALISPIHAHRPEPNDPPTPDEPDTVPDPTREPPMPDSPPIGDPPPTPNQQPHAV